SSKVPDARHIVVCAAALAGLAEVDPITASSFVGEGLAKGRLKVGNVLLNIRADSDGKVPCNQYRQPINPTGRRSSAPDPLPAGQAAGRAFRSAISARSRPGRD